jgi:hypothetical protein
LGLLLSSYKKAVFDEIANSIFSNTSQYYAFASNPIEYVEDPPVSTKDNYSSVFEYNWNMIFGKKINEDDIIPVIKKNIWTANTVYDRYDNTSAEIHTKNNFYVITEPEVIGGSYHVYKCINNANGAPSTVKPSSIGNPTQISNFITLPDNYEWRYITTISNELYVKFSTVDYAPVYPNTSISLGAANNSGVDVVVVANGGSGYINFTSGIVQSNPNTTVIKIANNSSEIFGFYTNNSIYLFNNTSSTSQLKTIANYVVNASGKWIITETAVNTALISSGSTNYSISPRVVFETDGSAVPTAFSFVNASTNSISSVIVFDTGSNISWANVRIQSSYGSGANLYAIVAPSGGHGKEPAVELDMKGYCVSFEFENDENGNIISSNTNYNKIGILKNPYSISNTGSKGDIYTSNTYSCLLKANVSFTFNKGEVVTGATSKARGTVVFANSSQVFLVGDKSFINGEFVSNATTSNVTTISITSRGDIYTKDLMPLYVQNINNVTRQENQSESFKIVIKL